MYSTHYTLYVHTHAHSRLSTELSTIYCTFLISSGRARDRHVCPGPAVHHRAFMLTALSPNEPLPFSDSSILAQRFALASLRSRTSPTSTPRITTTADAALAAT